MIKEGDRKYISSKEFHNMLKQGMKLVVLDDSIVNVEHYMFQHPGGEEAFSLNIGREISKFFYGG